MYFFIFKHHEHFAGKHLFIAYLWAVPLKFMQNLKSKEEENYNFMFFHFIAVQQFWSFSFLLTVIGMATFLFAFMGSMGTISKSPCLLLIVSIPNWNFQYIESHFYYLIVIHIYFHRLAYNFTDGNFDTAMWNWNFWCYKTRSSKSRLEWNF